ncbi:signal peptidase I [Hyalangium gracile]|uniref:signal peptidase I n=1 Tax=Hyalangium gracile TaxID=394092 RepID=UPI001CCA256F|nr:signal peptidase I [Hyalangium gracile]
MKGGLEIPEVSNPYAQGDMRDDELWQRGRAAWKRHQGALALAGAVVTCVVLLRTCVVQPRLISSDSMLPTLMRGDRVVVDQLSYRLGPVRAGDIILFEAPPQLVEKDPRQRGVTFIKRVVALPGQLVEVREGRVLVDGAPLREMYFAEAPDYAWGPERVPEGMLFVMGDNRNKSSDSHDWGFLPRSHVRGRAWVRFWPPVRAGGLQ